MAFSSPYFLFDSRWIDGIAWLRAFLFLFYLAWLGWFARRGSGYLVLPCSCLHAALICYIVLMFSLFAQITSREREREMIMMIFGDEGEYRYKWYSTVASRSLITDWLIGSVFAVAMIWMWWSFSFPWTLVVITSVDVCMCECVLKTFNQCNSRLHMAIWRCKGAFIHIHPQSTLRK